MLPAWRGSVAPGRVEKINGRSGMRRPLYLLALSAAIVLVLAPAALAQTESLNCEHFGNQEAAQAIRGAHGDLYGDDRDEGGLACGHPRGGREEAGRRAPSAASARHQ